MSEAKQSAPPKNHGQVIELPTEPKLKSKKESAKKKKVQEEAAALSKPSNEKKPKLKRLVQEQSEVQARIDAALAPIPDILKDLHAAEHGIQTQIEAVHQDFQKSAQNTAENLNHLRENTKNTERRYFRLLAIAVCAVAAALFFGIYLIFDSQASTKLMLQKMSNLETALSQNEIRNDLFDTRRTLTDAIKVNQQRIGENQKATQSVVKEIQKLNQAVAKLYELERSNANSR